MIGQAELGYFERTMAWGARDSARRANQQKANPDYVVYSWGMSYVVLHVTPEEGITEASFGHSAFTGSPGE